jgi:hypothetical protein
MSYYGLIAPAYACLFMIPSKAGTATERARWITLAIVLVLAGPAYFVGFIAMDMKWLLAGVAVVLLSRPILDQLTQRRPTP